MTEADKLAGALRPFARLGELIELETEGFADDDDLHIVLEDGHLMDRITVGEFRRAYQALSAYDSRSSPVADDGWLDIASAPKDGTEILLAILGAGQQKHWVHIGWWDEGEAFPWRFIDTFSTEPSGCCDDEDADRVPANAAREASVPYWRPLPPAPVVQPDEGWIEWKGGECPLPAGTRHEVKFRNGDEVEESCPRFWNWAHYDHFADIVKFRVVQP